jgi:hypothetical protein
MKISLLSILLLLFSVRAAAQHFEFGLNGGMVSNSVQNPDNNLVSNTNIAPENYTKFQSSVVSPMVSASAMYDSKHYQYGIAVENYTINYKGSTYHYYYLAGSLFVENTLVQYKDQEQPLKLFVNRVFRFKRLAAYGGLAAEYIWSKTTAQVPGQPTNVMPELIPEEHNDRLAADVHVGATYFVTKHIGINAEMACVYNHLPSGSPLCKRSFLFPGTLGVRYQL